MKPEDYVENPRDERPLTHAQSVEMLARLREAAGLKAMPIKAMPKARLVTQAYADKLRAFAQVKDLIEDSIARCEALENEPCQTE